jgi:hypothetical protein
MSIWNQLNVPQSNKLEKILLKNIEIKEVEKTETKKEEEKVAAPVVKYSLNFINRKRGRKKLGSKANLNIVPSKHNKFSDDNIKRKVKTHFHIFMISYLNMISRHILGKTYKFGKLSSDVTQNITVEYKQKLFDTKIRDLIIQISDKYRDKERNRISIEIIMKNPQQNQKIIDILNMNYKSFYINYYLKSNKDTFKDASYDESYEKHLIKLQKKFGNKYLENYKKNAENLIEFFYKCKKRIRKKPANISINNYITNGNCYANSRCMASTSTQTEMVCIDEEDDDDIYTKN